MQDEPQQWTQISLCVDPDKIHISPDRSAIYLGDSTVGVPRLTSQAAIVASRTPFEDATLDELEAIGTAIVLAVARARRPAQAVVA